jgi:hypothetical protein
MSRSTSTEYLAASNSHYLRRSAMCLIIALVAACRDGAPARTDSAASAAPVTSAPPAQSAPSRDAGFVVAESAEETPLAKEESLHEPRIELPGLPPYPNARSLARVGIGPVLKIGNSSTATYSVTASALDVANFYRKILKEDGWTEAFDGMGAALTHTTAISVLGFTKGQQVARIAYSDGLTGEQITGPRLSLTLRKP